MKAYWAKVILGYCGAIPFIFSFMVVFLILEEVNAILATSVLMSIAGIGTGIFAARKGKQPTQFNKRYMPIVSPLAFTLLLWMIFTILSGGFYGDNIWTVFAFLQLPFIVLSFASLLTGIGFLLFLPPVVFNSTFLISFFITERVRTTRTEINRWQLISTFIILFLLFSTGQFIHVKRSQTVLPSYGFDYSGGYSSTDLWPYDSENPSHILPELSEPATFTVTNSTEAMILDGAEAAYPVYSAFANETYSDNLKSLNHKYVTFTNTIYAYERLLNKEIDIYFGAEPSVEQLKMAEADGRELVMTPIGKEAFVFFVNKANPIDNLSISEIQSIYSGKTKNWDDVGGKKENIIAFQRPKNSGSQTLLEKIMGKTRIMTPLKEEVPAGMGGILEQVADYRNYKNALGFSFRFFASDMHDINDMKLIAIDGIEPSIENITQETYPFTAQLYAITLKDNTNSTIQPFLNWMQGPQGQEIIEKIGYVRLKEK